MIYCGVFAMHQEVLSSVLLGRGFSINLVLGHQIIAQNTSMISIKGRLDSYASLAMLVNL